MRAKLALQTKFLALAGIVTATTANAGTGDEVAGKAVFARCSACHRLDQSGTSGIGPNLYKVIDRRAGSMEGFRYSPAMAASKLVWTDETLDAFLLEPARVIPGNKMVAAPVRNPAERANLIAYIRSASR